MKKMFLVATAVLLAVGVMSVVASAQQGGGGARGGFAGVGMSVNLGAILRNADLKAQLGITDEQTQKIDQINQESRQARGGGAGAGQMTAAERAEREKQLQATQDKIKAVLKPEQLEKAKVLLFQVSGGLEAGALSVDTLEALGLTDDQKAKIKVIADERAEKMRALMGDGDAADRRAKMTEIRNAAAEKVKAVLTADQKAKGAKLAEEGKDIREKFLQQQGQGQGRGGRN